MPPPVEYTEKVTDMSYDYNTKHWQDKYYATVSLLKRLEDNHKELTDLLREANGRLGEYEHAMGHIVHCTTGTVLCLDCKRLAHSALEGKHWIDWVDEQAEEAADDDGFQKR